MDNVEARALLVGLLRPLRDLAYDELVARYLKQPTSGELTAASGTWYQYEIEAAWDNRKRGPLRVMACIDDGGRSAYRPVCEDFIIRSDGSFVGE